MILFTRNNDFGTSRSTLARGKAWWVPLQRVLWQGGALCGTEMFEGKRGRRCLAVFAGVEVRFASWGVMVICTLHPCPPCTMIYLKFQQNDIKSIMEIAFAGTWEDDSGR